MFYHFEYQEYYETYLKEANVRILHTYPGINVALPSWDLLLFDDIMIDSGGYQIGMGTAAWLKHVINKNPGQVTHYITLDTQDPQETAAKFRYMVSKGLEPMPVWKPGWDWKYLTECYQLSELVAIGGLVGEKRKPAQYYLYLHRIIQADFPNNKFHLFGLGVTGAIFTEPKPFSIDFSIWIITIGMETM